MLETIQMVLSRIASGNALDMVGYLVLAQALPAIGLVKLGPGDPAIGRYTIASQAGLIVLFFLIWGGYAVDSTSYLTGFDGSPFVYHKEWLFWALGYVLDKLVYDPWPLKILSALGAAGMCFSIAWFYRGERRHTAAALFALLLIPAFYVLMGNAIRQGLAGALVVFGIVALHQGNKTQFSVAAGLAFFIHQASIAFALAGVLSKLAPRRAVYALALAPFVSFVAYRLGTLLGVDVADYIPYADGQEGIFHWSKFFVAYALAGIALLATRNAGERDVGMVSGYAYMVAGAALLLKYEVPFERLLDFAGLLLPWAGVATVTAIGWRGWRLAMLWFGGLIAGTVLWTHPSILHTLGYTSA